MRYISLPNIFVVMLSIILSLSVVQEQIQAKCPCDIYAEGGTPCAAAHSMVRALYDSYNGPLYQVRRISDQKTIDIGVVAPGGYANVAPQDSFLKGTSGRISIVYDQTPNHNDLKSHCTGTWGPADTEANVTDAPFKLNGHTVYGLKTYGGFSPAMGVGYRNNATKGMPTGNQPEGTYMVCNGKYYNQWCCFDYGSAESNGLCNGKATMDAIYFGNSTQWGHGSGSGPWVMADMENGMVAGADYVDNNNTSIIANYVTAILKGGWRPGATDSNWYSIRAGDAQDGKLKTMYAGKRPSGYYPMKLDGAIILGIGGDNSHTGIGIFYEGAIVKGVPTDATEDSLQANIIAAGYGSNVTSTRFGIIKAETPSIFKLNYNPTNGKAVIRYALQESRRVSMSIFDQHGRQMTALVNDVRSPGMHTEVWNTKGVPSGVYVCKAAVDGMAGWADKIIIGK